MVCIKLLVAGKGIPPPPYNIRSRFHNLIVLLRYLHPGFYKMWAHVSSNAEFIVQYSYIPTDTCNASLTTHVRP
jgi:hypothetical protein